MRKFVTILNIIIIIILVHSCANKAQGPTGGPKDETPPKIIRSVPLNGALNFKKKEVHVLFDENISVQKVSENVIISPPQIKQPDVKGIGKTVIVTFQEDLLDSTTYTINFGDAIVDLNENNPLKDYRFSFSTGNQIDTLKISGTLINAEDLNPVPGIIVGIYRDEEDTVFSLKPFLRIGKTNENGRFVIDNVKAGKYKVFALGDTNQDYYYQAGESLAMLDSMVTPSFRIQEMKDTVWKDSATVDSVRTYMGTYFLPDNIIMRYFKESKKRQSLLKNDRKIPQAISLIFNMPNSTPPVVKPLNFDWEGKYIIQKNNQLDSLTYWITDSTLYAKDTLDLSVSYQVGGIGVKTETITDTVSAIFKKPKINPKAKQQASTKTDPEANKYRFNTNLSTSFDVYRSIGFTFDAPLKSFDLSKISLSEKIDTVLKPLQFKWKQTDSTMMAYAIEYKWEPEKTYDLKIDSATFLSLYHKSSDKFTSQFKIRSLDEYSSMKIILAEYDSTAVIQVVDAKDMVLFSKPALKKGTVFEYLKPGDYFLKLFIDKNKNGKWDTGDFLTLTQPEEVYYYSKKLSLRANWEFEETWNFKDTPVLEQKPAELRKETGKKKGK